MDGNTTLGVLFGLGLGAASCLVVAVNGQTPPAPAVNGVHDLELTWALEQRPSGPEGTSAQAAPSSDGVSHFTAVQEQVGLKLEAQPDQVDVLVIESAERPVED